jgi:hypothetical protein
MICSSQLAYPREYNFILEIGERNRSIKRRVNFPSFEVCESLEKCQKKVSILLANIVAEGNYGIGGVVGETCEHLL